MASSSTRLGLAHQGGGEAGSSAGREFWGFEPSGAAARLRWHPAMTHGSNKKTRGSPRLPASL